MSEASSEPARHCILHVDMDAFYVSVELRRRPELVGRPVVVGGSGSRGVVAAANYEARRFGVFSAMSSTKARRLCPDAVFLSGDHEHYAEVSRQVHAIFGDFTPYIEPIALDEAFLDVTGSRQLFGTGAEIGRRIRARVHDELALPCSVGVSTTKFIAKLASKKAKPVVTPRGVEPGAGVLEIDPGTELDFLHPLPIQSLWGVGPVTFTKLERIGVRRVGDLVTLGRDALESALGKAAGRHLFELANGIDERPVATEREVKSISHEETFAHDITEHSAMRVEIVRLADAVTSRLRRHGSAARTVTLKIRFANFENMTRSITPGSPISSAPAIVRALDDIVAAVDPSPGIRLIGVAVSGLVEPVEQLSLLDDPATSTADTDRNWAPASSAVDQIRDKFGRDAINPASVLRRRSDPGSRPWGPDRGDEPV
ncbi:MAG: DNA polymerase IV [Actinomycetota bacterium]